MSDKAQPSLTVTVDGTKLPPDLMHVLTLARLSTSVYDPDMFELRFHTGFKEFDKARFVLGTPVKFELKGGGTSFKTEGLVVSTGMVPSPAGGLDLWVLGYDHGYRLTRQPRTRTFTEVDDESIVRKVLGEYADLDADVDSPGGTHTYVMQCVQTDWQFLKWLARLRGCDLWCSGTTIHFAKRPSSDTTPPTLTWGKNLLDLDVRFSATATTASVTVDGWDLREGKVITASADTADPGCTAKAAQMMADAAQRSTAFDKVEVTLAHVGVTSTDEAEVLARSVLDAARSTEVRLAGECDWDPTVTPGATVTLDQVGDLLGGDYLITEVTHVINGRQCKTAFRSGSRVGNGIVGLLAGTGAASAAGVPGASPVTSQLVVATVTNNSDDDKLGRVKVKYHVSDEDESPWIPVVSPSKDIQSTPEKDDQVLVGFLASDPRQPVVLGVVFSSASPPPLPDAGDGAKTTKVQIGAGDSHILFDTAAGKLTVKGKTIDLNPPG